MTTPTIEEQRDKLLQYIFSLEETLLLNVGRVPTPKKALEKQLDSLLTTIDQNARENCERIVHEEMDKMEHATKAELMACDELAINIIKRLSHPTTK